MILGVDIETCSAADIDNGASPYAEHETTRAHCAVFSLSSRRGDNRVFRWAPGAALPSWVVRHIMSGGPVLAHNAPFEASMWEFVMSPVHGFPPVRVEQWIDTLLVAAALNLPLALGLLGPTIGAAVLKDEEGKKLMLAVADVEKVNGEWIYPVLSPATLARLTDYCEVDVLSMVDCWWKLPRLTREEYQTMIVDRRINARGAMLDLPLAAAMGRMAVKREHEIGAEVWRQTQDLIGMTNVPALMRWLHDRGVVLPKVVRKRADGQFKATESIDRASIATLLAQPTLAPDVRAALSLRIEAGRVTSLAKATKVPVVVNQDGRLRHALRYCRAHTGRWSSEVLQVHNLARSTDDFKIVAEAFAAAVRANDMAAASTLHAVLDGLSFMLRSLVIARPGCDLVGGDYASIEARGMSWVAGFHDKLDVFRRYDSTLGQPKDVRRQLDPYVVAAAKIGSDNRQLGKVCELALQYGMGAIKFRDTAAKAGVQLTLKQAREIQLAWRRANKPIVDFWHRLQDAVAEAMTHFGTPMFVGEHITVIGGKECLRIVLPSGRALHYWRPHQKDVIREIETVDKEGNIITDKVQMRELRFFTADKRGMVPESTYGGKLTENVVQALSRDVLRDALIRLDRSPYAVVLHVHDSIAAEVPSGTGEVSEFCRLMAETPSWATGLPIAVEGYRSRHFKG